MTVDLNHGSGCHYGDRPKAHISTLKIPSGIGEKLRRELDRVGIGNTAACRKLGISMTTLARACREAVWLSPEVACRLHRIGIDGRALYLEQMSNRLRWHETREARR